MCGIFAYLLTKNANVTFPLSLRKKLLKSFSESQHRGPDNSIFKTLNSRVCLGFHRLCIMDMTDKGNQPLELKHLPGVYLICNGEIYNYEKLATDNGFNMYSGSDCEVILHMFDKYGLEETVKQLDGVFAFVLYDSRNDILYAARDPFGVRALYMGTSENNDIVLSSELKSIHKLVQKVDIFPPGCWLQQRTVSTLGKLSGFMTRYYHYDYNVSKFPHSHDEEQIQRNVRLLFENAVEKRLMSERPVGCLLSGGLDSSLVTALVSKHFPKKTLHTFSIGLEGSEDLKFAQIVADHLDTIHHEIVVTEEEMLGFLKKDIWTIETYDTTTIRASTPMLLMSHYIKEKTDITVVYSGEGSDEASGSYLYFHNAPSPEDFQKECIRLLEDLHYFDVLRCDKSTSGAGLEVRVPFLDKEFLQYYMSIPPKYKVPRNGIEKYLLRKSFDGLGLLPDCVLWRQKEGFSDGCSSKKKSWYQIIQSYVDDLITDEEYEKGRLKYTHNPPMFKEAYFYREVFNNLYENSDHTVPYYWLPKWSGDLIEPSARVLNVYEQEEDEKDIKTVTTTTTVSGL